MVKKENKNNEEKPDFDEIMDGSAFISWDEEDLDDSDEDPYGCTWADDHPDD